MSGTAIERLRKVAEELKRDDMSGAIKFTIKYQDLSNTYGCARVNPLHKRNISVCMECEHLDRLNIICKAGKAEFRGVGIKHE